MELRKWSWKLRAIEILAVGMILALAQSEGVALPANTVSPLYARGYSVIPQPQQVTPSEGDFEFGSGWQVTLSGVKKTDAAVESVTEDMQERFHVAVRLAGGGGKTITLSIRSGSVKIGKAADKDKNVIAEQAYRLELKPDTISITANASPGLFYGVQTLLQLVTPRGGKLWLPQATITDWPDLQHREMYWDDAHHLDRPEALKEVLKKAAFFKMNRVAIKLEGHFQFKSVPEIVNPQALTAAQLQELTDYGLRRHVQIIPWLDGPAHVAFILKHPEYKHLRAFPESNYEFCATNPETYKLLFGMFDELIAATKGTEYFHLSTDEAYYIGMADNAQCREKARMEKLGSVGKLLAEFVTKTGDYLKKKGRTAIIWGEYPLKADDLTSLPSHIVSGLLYGEGFEPVFKKHGIRQLIYTSTQGVEPLFPRFYDVPSEDRLHPESREPGPRSRGVFNTVSNHPRRSQADLKGVVVAGWADAGLHADTFWLGYVTGTAAGWHPGSPDPEETEHSFYRLYYGPSAVDMGRVYQLMSRQTHFWRDSWDKTASTYRKPIWGDWDRIYTPPHASWDYTLAMPPMPSFPYLNIDKDWKEGNERRLAMAEKYLRMNDELLDLLHANLQNVEHNRYTVEVMLSVARLCRQNILFIQGLDRISSHLRAAEAAVADSNPRRAVAQLDQALGAVGRLKRERNQAFSQLTNTWEKTWFPRVAGANGRKFRHELDDVKDHRGDRTIDLSYHILRQLLLPFDEWVAEVGTVRNKLAQDHKLQVRKDSFDWKKYDDGF